MANLESRLLSHLMTANKRYALVEPGDHIWLVQATHPQAYERGQKITYRMKGPVPDSVLRPIRGLPLKHPDEIKNDLIMNLKFARMTYEERVRFPQIPAKPVTGEFDA
jgi:hypothetical protein